MSPLISVLTPSIRVDRLEIVRKALANQTQNISFEWLVGSPFEPKLPGATWVKDDFKGGFWSLARIYNKMVREARGALVVSLQDSVWVSPTGLEQFAVVSEAYPDSVITGVGGQFLKSDNNGEPYQQCWADPRIKEGDESFKEVPFTEVEYNWCCLPRQMILDIGNWDTAHDTMGFTPCGGFQLSERLKDAGKKFYQDNENISKSLRHGRESYGGSTYWNDNSTFKDGSYQARRSQLKAEGNWPVIKQLTKFKKLD